MPANNVRVLSNTPWSTPQFRPTRQQEALVNAVHRETGEAPPTATESVMGMGIGALGRAVATSYDEDMLSYMQVARHDPFAPDSGRINQSPPTTYPTISGDLMEIVNECRPLEIPTLGTMDKALDKAAELKQLGFDAAAITVNNKVERALKLAKLGKDKYVAITNEKILSFLRRKAAAYDKERGVARDPDLDRISSFTGKYEAVGYTCDGGNYKGIGKILWQECMVSSYPSIPPQKALDAMAAAKEKKIFDYFTVATVEQVKDPLLLGRIKGIDDTRFFIAQWGDDICLDDLI